MPVYSVLVALYQEADIVADLVDALDRIVWPKAKLEIKLVCEEDDLPTLAALDQSRLPAHMEVVRVPVFGPRTKPKALAYALPLVSGDFVALYDAEDSPIRCNWSRPGSASAVPARSLPACRRRLR